jgi:hypothetical protein
LTLAYLSASRRELAPQVVGQLRQQSRPAMRANDGDPMACEPARVERCSNGGQSLCPPPSAPNDRRQISPFFGWRAPGQLPSGALNRRCDMVLRHVVVHQSQGARRLRQYYSADLVPNRLRHTLTNTISHNLPYGVKNPRAFNRSTVSLALILAVLSSAARSSSPLIGYGAGGVSSIVMPHPASRASTRRTCVGCQCRRPAGVRMQRTLGAPRRRSGSLRRPPAALCRRGRASLLSRRRALGEPRRRRVGPPE